MINPFEDEYPCRHCGSPRHGSLAHHKLLTTVTRWEPWAIGWEHSLGMPGGRSPGELVLVPPDLTLIVPSIIGVDGGSPLKVVNVATLRLWNPDPSDGLTFMLSYDSHALSGRERWSLEEGLGSLGSTATVAVRFASMTPSEARGST